MGFQKAVKMAAQLADLRAAPTAAGTARRWVVMWVVPLEKRMIAGSAARMVETSAALMVGLMVGLTAVPMAEKKVGRRADVMVG